MLMKAVRVNQNSGGDEVNGTYLWFYHYNYNSRCSSERLFEYIFIHDCPIFWHLDLSVNRTQ